MDDRKIAVTGAAGLLGSEILNEIDRIGAIGISIERAELDLSQSGAALPVLANLEPKVVIHCAAETNVDKCETDPGHAYRVNTEATFEIAQACRKIGARLVYISSCGIFDGKSRIPYIENDVPFPVTHYARSKFAAEEKVQSLNSQNLVCRVGWLFGGGIEKKKNFVEARRKEALKAAKMVSAVDKWGSPTYAQHAAERIVALATKGVSGLMHVANSGVASRYDYVCAIIDIFGLPVPVEPADSSQFRRAAPVPDFEAISSSRLESLGLTALPHWRVALESYISKAYPGHI